MTGQTRRSRPRGAILSIAAALSLVLAVAAPGGAQTEEPVGGPLELGPWWGSGGAVGLFTGNYDGAAITWDGELGIDVQFSVSESGAIDFGSWEMAGLADTLASGRVDGEPIEVASTIAYDGSGTIGGTNTALLLSGAFQVSGTAVVSGDGRELSLDVDETTDVDELEVRVLATACDEAYGDWALAFESGLEASNIVEALSGYGGMMLLRDVELAQEYVDQIVDSMGDPAAMDDEVAEDEWVFAMVVTLQRDYNAFIDKAPDWTLDEVFDLLERAEELLNLFRNFTACDAALFGEGNVAMFFGGLTFMIQNLLVQEWVDIPATAWQSFVQIAYRVGSAGPGSPYPDLSADVEQSLQSMANDILERNTDENGDLLVTDETRIVMATLAAMGWDYEIDGVPYSARATYEATVGDAPVEP